MITGDNRYRCMASMTWAHSKTTINCVSAITCVITGMATPFIAYRSAPSANLGVRRYCAAVPVAVAANEQRCVTVTYHTLFDSAIWDD